MLEIKNLNPRSQGAFRWLFWHGRIVSDQVQVINKISYLDIFSSSNLQNIDISLPFTESIR